MENYDLTELEKSISEDPRTWRLYKDNRGKSLVHLAAEKNRVTLLDLLINRSLCDINGRDKLDNTPLHLAIKEAAADAVIFLLRHNADGSLRNCSGNASIHLAVILNKLAILQILIDHSNCFDPLSRGESGKTPLHFAAIHDRTDCAKLLLGATKFFCLKNPCANGFTSLHEAARNSAANTLKIMLDWGETMGHTKLEMMSYVDREGNIPLHSAIHGGDIKCVRYCLGNGARMIAQQSDLSTALHLACSMGQLDVVTLMFSMQPEDKCQCMATCDAQKKTPFHYAAMFDHVQVVEFLLKEGTNINAVDGEERSALLLAASRGAWRTVRLLLKERADVSIRDSSGRNILHYIVIHGGTLEEFAPDIENDKLRQLLNDKDLHGCTPLHYASKGGKIRSTESLLQLGAYVNPKNNWNESPLHFAAKYGRYNTAVELLNGDSGPSIINESDGNGKTPLHIASENGHKKVVMLLLAKGALLQRDHRGRTPLHLAAKNGFTKTMALMLTIHVHLLDRVDKDGNTPLHLAAQENRVGAITLLLNENCKLLHNNHHHTPMDLVLVCKHSEAAMAMATHEDRGNEILRMNCEKAEGVIQALIALMPEVYVAVLDRCITKSGLKQDSEDYYIKYSFKYLQYSREISKQMESRNKNFKTVPLPAMNTMVQYKRLELLCHPVCQKYIQMKWKAYGMYFHMVNLIVYMIFMTLLTLYSAVLMDIIPQQTSIYATAHSEDSFFPQPILAPASFYLKAVVVIIFVTLNIVKEIVQLYQQKAKYILDPINLLEWILYISATIMVYPVFSGQLHQEHIACAAVAVFLAWFNFLLYLQRFDRVGIYVVMFLEILKTLVKALLIFSILFIAFGLAFYILLSRGHHLGFSNIPVSLVRVFCMMLGEFDIQGTFIQPYFATKNVMAMRNATATLPYPHFSFGFLLIFMISMPILLVNLLIGLAVGDIESVRRNAYLKRLAMQVELHTELERKLPLILLERVDKTEMIEYPNSPKRSRFPWLWPLVQKWFGSVYTNSSEKLLEYSENGQQDDYIYEELYKQRQKMKDMSTALNNIHGLVRLIVQKMEIRVELNNCDEGAEQTPDHQGRTKGSKSNTRWTSPAFRRKVNTIATLMKRARDPTF